MNDDLKPRRKVVASTAGSLIAGILVYALNELSGRKVPAEQAAALGTLLTMGITFLAGYMTPAAPRPADTLTALDVAMLKWMTVERTQDPPGWKPDVSARPAVRRTRVSA